MITPGDTVLEFARSVAAEAGLVAMSHFRRCGHSWKDDGTVVTEADREIEALLRSRIGAAFPEDGVIGEELGVIEARSGHSWVVDPIDGTAWFALGLPMFGILVARCFGGVPELGVVHFPVTRETWSARTGGGCWYGAPDCELREVSCRSSVTRLADAFCSASGIHGSDLSGEAEDLPGLSRVYGQAARFRFAGDCYQHMLVASGRLDVAIDTRMRPWDSAALIPCLTEAGAAVCLVDGSRNDLVNGGSLVSASSEALLEEVVALLRPSHQARHTRASS